MPPRRELPLRGARDDPKAWPPSSAALRPCRHSGAPRSLGVASPGPRPPFIRTRERVSNFFGPWRSPIFSQRCCATSAWLFDFCNRFSMRRTGTVPVGQILARRRGLPLVRCHTRLRFRAAALPLCGGRTTPSAAASHAHLSDARSCDRTLSAEHGDPPPRELGGSDMREAWAGGPRDLGRSTLRDCRPSVHRAGLASGAFQLELQPSISCHRRSGRAGMDPVRLDFAGRGCRRVASPRRAAPYVNRDAFHHLEPTHGRDCSLLESRQRLRRTPSPWDVARRSTHTVLHCVPLPGADTPSMASTGRPKVPEDLLIPRCPQPQCPRRFLRP